MTGENMSDSLKNPQNQTKGEVSAGAADAQAAAGGEAAQEAQKAAPANIGKAQETADGNANKAEKSGQAENIFRQKDSEAAAESPPATSGRQTTAPSDGGESQAIPEQAATAPAGPVQISPGQKSSGQTSPDQKSPEQQENEEPQKRKILFDYKDPLSLYPFLEGWKIPPARASGLSRSRQKQLRLAVKKARALGLLPSHNQAYDDFERPAPVSLKPFEY